MAGQCIYTRGDCHRIGRTRGRGGVRQRASCRRYLAKRNGGGATLSIWNGCSMPGCPRRRERSRVAESPSSARVVRKRTRPRRCFAAMAIHLGERFVKRTSAQPLGMNA
eukprot:scaffold9231_cov134-Isochrysis_galbana.AAC.2